MTASVTYSRQVNLIPVIKKSRIKKPSYLAIVIRRIRFSDVTFSACELLCCLSFTKSS